MIANRRPPTRRDALAVAVFMTMILSTSIGLQAAESTEGLVSTPGWRCEVHQRRAFRDDRSQARQLLRAARTTEGCHVVADRFERCEPAVLTTPSSGDAATAAGTEATSGSQLCVLLECDQSDAESEPQVLELDDAFGQRSVSVVALDRVCVNLD